MCALSALYVLLPFANEVAVLRTPTQRADTPRDRHPKQMDTAADGTHPTGKHSCSINVQICSALRITIF